VRFIGLAVIIVLLLLLDAKAQQPSLQETFDTLSLKARLCEQNLDATLLRVTRDYGASREADERLKWVLDNWVTPPASVDPGSKP